MTALNRQADAGLLGSARIALLTVTGVQETFGLRDNITATGYWVRDRQAYKHDVVLRRASAQTNLVSAELAGDIVQDFRPAFFLLIGTAGGFGGRDDVALGDVVVSNYVEFSGYWKYKENQILRRKIAHDHPSLFLLVNFVDALSSQPEEWRQHIRVARPENGAPSVRVGEIVCGDVLLGDPDNQEQNRIPTFFDKALAFEMEGVGLARTMFKARQWVRYNPQFLIVRGISDLVNTNAAENQGVRVAWTPYAVASLVPNGCAIAAVIGMDFVAICLCDIDRSGASRHTCTSARAGSPQIILVLACLHLARTCETGKLDSVSSRPLCRLGAPDQGIKDPREQESARQP